jgi:hypothetical protein
VGQFWHTMGWAVATSVGYPLRRGALSRPTGSRRYLALINKWLLKEVQNERDVTAGIMNLSG